jgi:carnosine N-methyltransferase
VFQHKTQTNANNVNDSATTSNNTNTSTATREVSSYDSLKHILVHLARDWGDRGSETRRLLYTDCILPFARKYISSVNDISSSDSAVDEDPTQQLKVERGAPSILVPGAGLGRLAIELVAAGFRYVKC